MNRGHQPRSRLVLVSGLEALTLGIPRSAWRGRPEINIDGGYVDRRLYARAQRRAMKREPQWRPFPRPTR